MIRAILLDLDDTLIHTDTDSFFRDYLADLARHSAELEAPEAFLKHLMEAFGELLAETRPTETLNERLLGRLAQRYGRSVESLQALFDRYYAEDFPRFMARIQPRPESGRLLDLLQQRSNCVVVATNPALPLTAIQQRMSGGAIPEGYPFALVTSLESMHFGKPDPRYYAEIACHRDADSAAVLMVGNDWDADIVPAHRAGMHSYWVTENGAEPPDPGSVTAWGSYAAFVERIAAGWLDELAPREESRSATVMRLATFPAAVDSLCRQNSTQVLEFRPAAEEWSVRDILCHLRDGAHMDDRRILETIAEAVNPFVQPNYSPWDLASNYEAVSVREALESFARERVSLVKWLHSVPAEAWARPARHPIFGPTSFGEMVSYIVSHDRAHWRQMQQAVEVAIPLCREDSAG